jgi:prepilin-type N-terminal cleavage/methylation domain-containing protein
MNKKKGFTLIELIVAVLFFGLASASIAFFYAGNSKRIVDSEKSARMEVVAEKAYETFKGNLMERMYVGEEYYQLVFDSIWDTYDEGDTVFTFTEEVSGVSFNSNIFIDSFSFDTAKATTKDDARSFNSGSRMWATIKTERLSLIEGDLKTVDSFEMQTIFTHHR